MHIHRILESKVRNLAEHFPVVMICGARQVGKTALLKKIAEESGRIQYVTLDFPRNRQLAKEDPDLFLQKYAAPLIIDEIQHAPELLTHIKLRTDEKRGNGMYYLAGSQMFHTMRNVGESLAGRMAVLSMYSLSRAEMEGRESGPFNPAEIDRFDSVDTVTGIFDRILKGGMPCLMSDAEISGEEYYGSYMQTYIERDIRDLISIRDESKFLKFVSCVAAKTSQEVNLAAFAKDVEIDRKTADSWLSLLVASGLVVLLRPYAGNTVRRVVKRPKLYFMDTGLACYLSMWNNPKALEISAMGDAMFENYVVSEIVKSYANSGLDFLSRLAYYRDNNGNEIDLLITENGVVHPVEIRKSSDQGKEAIRNFSVLSSLAEDTGEGAVLCMSPMVIPMDSKNRLIPVGAI